MSFKMNYLVTGGSGFCGFEIVKHLLTQGHRVRVLDVETLPEKLPGVEYLKVDIRDAAAVLKAAEGQDRIIHCIAKVPVSKAGKDFWTVNVDGTRNILEAALKLRISKVVHLSSSAVQLSKVNPVPEDAPLRPIGEYARSKREAETVCEEYRAKGLAVDIIRPRTVVGPGRLGIFCIFFEWISEGKNVYLIGNGRNTIQFLHASDLASCCFLASLQSAGETYNVGSRQYAPLREDLQALLDFAASRSRLISLPVLPAIAALATLDFLRLSPLASWHYLSFHKDFYFNNEKAKRILGWEPRFGNREILIESYSAYLKKEHSPESGYGTSHRKHLRQGILKLLKVFS